MNLEVVSIYQPETHVQFLRYWIHNEPTSKIVDYGPCAGADSGLVKSVEMTNFFLQ